MKSMPRTNKIFLVVGNRGTGKTDFCKNMLQLSPMPKKLIVDTFDNPAWRNMKTHDHPDWENITVPVMPVDMLNYHKGGLYRIFHTDTDFLQDEIDKYCMNSLVLVEDATRYFPLNLTRSQKNYLLNSKQKNLDIILVFHFLSTVPPELLKMADYLTIFKTNEAQVNEKKYFHPGFKEAFNHVYNSKNRFENKTIRLQ